VVLFGSIGREEMTSGSDADWILLVDGQAVPEHEDQKRDTGQILAAHDFGKAWNTAASYSPRKNAACTFVAIEG
jgi:Nucleotidyltransferase domain